MFYQPYFTRKLHESVSTFVLGLFSFQQTYMVNARRCIWIFSCIIIDDGFTLNQVNSSWHQGYSYHIFQGLSRSRTPCGTTREQWISHKHYDDVTMDAIASQITSLAIVYSAVYSDADQRKHESSASLAFVWGIHRDRWSPRTKGQLRGKCFHLMT